MPLYQLDADQLENIIDDLDTRYDLGLVFHGRAGLRAAYTLGSATLCIEGLDDGAALDVVGDPRARDAETRAAIAAIKEALAPWRLDRGYAGQARAMQADLDAVLRVELWREKIGPASIPWPMERADWEALRVQENPAITRVDLATGWDQVKQGAARMQEHQTAAAEIQRRSAAERATDFLMVSVNDTRAMIERMVETPNERGTEMRPAAPENRVQSRPDASASLEDWCSFINPAGKPGRPTKEENIEAAVEVYLKHRCRQDVFQEWLERASNRDLADSWESFEKMLPPLRRKILGIKE